MSYETAPATLMLATHCVVCQRPLVDAESVESGMGPECRRKHGYNVNVDPEDRHDANKLVHDLAAMGESITPQALANATEGLRLLGFEQLADVITRRRVHVRIALDENLGAYVVTTPYNEAFVYALKNAIARTGGMATWDKASKAWLVPESARLALVHVLRSHFKGSLAIGPKGPFTV